jgi:hypothetical protein
VFWQVSGVQAASWEREMATVHILQYIGGGNYRAVLHVPMPTGSNEVGTPWKTCYLATFLPRSPATILPVGNGPGQISQSESNSISSGDLMEFEFVVTDDSGGDPILRNTIIDTVAADVKKNKLEELQQALRFFGYTRA